MSACSALGDLLRQELEAAVRLRVVLGTEHEAIARRDTDTLQQAVAEKQELLAHLERSHKQRLALLSASGMDADPDGFVTLLARCADSGHDWSSRWDELKETLIACQRQNQVNGAVLENSRRATHQALSILLGGQADSPELYNQAGKAMPSQLGGSRIIKA